MAGKKLKISFEDLKSLIAEAAGYESIGDELHYTDASKYAEQYYGETYRATTGLDNDWGNY